MPVLEDHNYDYFQFDQAMERYLNTPYAAESWGLFLAIVAILGILSLILNELYRQ